MLLFVPTPIGNLGDITLRALDSLKTASLIACEDTRHSRRLLASHGIDKPLLSLHEHNEEQRIPRLLERLRAGETIAVVSDAGTPCLSDPGYRLHQACLENGLPVTVLPGACAITTALAGSGFPTCPFSFRGFLPVKKGKRHTILEAALAASETTLFFESPHRLASTLGILAALAPAQKLCIARELTKIHETYHRGTSAELHARFSATRPKGELVIVLPPASSLLKKTETENPPAR